MFENGSLFVLENTSDKNSVVFRIEVDADTQHTINCMFAEATEVLTNSKQSIEFDGRYIPNEDEILSIENFCIDDIIKDAIRNPIGVASYDKKDGLFPEIRALFVGECINDNSGEIFNISFQKFKKDQYISSKNTNLFFSENTFIKDSRFGISISPFIDCIYTGRALQFISYFYTRQIFDLNSYYRTATNSEVQGFATHPLISVTDVEAFKTQANSWVRRKIASISDSNVLENNTAVQIKNLAQKVGIEINVDNMKIVLPDNYGEDLKKILCFLDEEAYKGPFSKVTYLANSKRKANASSL